MLRNSLCSRLLHGAAALAFLSLTISGIAQIATDSNGKVHRLKPADSFAASAASILRMKTNPVSTMLQQLARKRGQTATAVPSHGSLVPADSSTSMTFPGYVQAPWTAARQSTDTSNTISAVSADFNGDGKSDVASIQNDGTVNVLLSSTGGDFVSSGLLSSTSLGTSTDGTSWLLAADMNHDGKTDLVGMTVYYGGGGIGGFSARKKSASRVKPTDSIDEAGTYLLVYLNDGTGKFAAPLITNLQTTNYSDSSVWNVAVGDINGDGVTDVVAISNELVFQYGDDGSVTTQDITIEQSFLNDGTGTLTPMPEYDYTYNDWLQPSIFQEQLIDMNHDGKLDLVSVIAPDGQQVFTTIQVQLGNGDGTFAPLPEDAIGGAKATIPFYNGGNNLVVADVNGDGFPDVVLASNSQSNPGLVYVALNDGSGALGSANAVIRNIDYPFLSAINVADVNADGKQDLLVYTSGQVAIYSGNGDGTFSAGPISQYMTGYTFGVRPAPADFNGDGKLDIADVDGMQNKAALYTGNGDLTFYGASALAPSGENGINFQAVASGDFLAASQTSVLGQDWTQMNADFYPNMYSAFPDGSGGLKYVPALTADTLDAAGAQYVEPVTADFNGDSANDLIIAVSGGLSIAFSNKDGSFGPLSAINLGAQLACTASFVDTGDMNGDGYLDIVVAYPGDAYCGAGSTVPSGYFVLLNAHDGTFTPSFTAFGTSLYQPKLIDLNGDGTLDLVVADNDTNDLKFLVTAISGKGDGTFDASSAAVVLSNYSISSLISGDFNGDGKQDLTIATAGAIDSSGNILPGYPGVAVLAGHGDMTFDAPVFVDAGHLSSWGNYSDLNGDGLLDLVLADADSTTGEAVSNLVTVLNTGNGIFAAPQETYLASYSLIYGSEAYTSYVFTGDFNLDGSPDVVNTGSFGSGLFVNSGGVKLALAYQPSQILAGQSTTLTATLTSTVSMSVPTGNVIFTSDGASLGSGTVSNGVASLTTSAFTTGSHAIEARYSGDAAHNLAVADTSVKVIDGGVKFALSYTPEQPIVGQSTTLTATLTSTVGANQPTGTVMFLSDGNMLNSAHVSSGVASITTTALTAGTHTIEAQYAGDSLHNTATTDTSVDVLATAPDFTISTPENNSIALAEGASTSASLSVAANQSFSGSVNVACSGAPSGVTCTSTPASLTLDAGKSGSVTVNIAAATSVASNSESMLEGAGGSLIAVAALMLLPLRRRARLLMVVAFAAMLGSMTLITGCGGQGTRVVNQSTLTITASSGSITKTQTISLTVMSK
jgi:hypothetical protein